MEDLVSGMFGRCAIFSTFFCQEFCKEDADLLNDETFGVTDDIPELSDGMYRLS